MAAAQPALAGELVAVEPSPVAMGNLRGSDARALIRSASDMASALAQIIEQRGLFVKIQGRDYVMCEGWTTLATMCGLMPREVSCEYDREDDVFIATVALVRISDGMELTRASAECGGDSDATWAKRPRYARRSMAITRATSKSCRIALSWVMNLAGYEPTPLEDYEGIAYQDGVEEANKKHGPEEPESEPATIGKDKQKAVWRIAAVRVKELIERGDLPPKAEPDVIMRDILSAWALEHTADIPRKNYDRFVALVNKWLPGTLPDDMRPAEGF